MNLTFTGAIRVSSLFLILNVFLSISVYADPGVPFYCPEEHVYVDCGDLKSDLDYYGHPRAKSYSYHLDITPYVHKHLDECGRGKIERKWLIKYHYETYWCKQIIHIKDGHGYGSFDPHYHAKWPKDYHMKDCHGSAHPEHMPKGYDWPSTNYHGCSKIGVRYEDKSYPYDPHYHGSKTHYGKHPCKVIYRTWEMIDWCQYEGSHGHGHGYGHNNGKGIWYKTQYIYVYDEEAPKIHNCPDDIVVDQADCHGSKIHLDIEKITASDDCGHVFLSHKKTFMHGYHDSHSGYSYSNAYTTGGKASGHFYPGKTKVEVLALDVCGNKAQCEFYVDVNFEDKKPPTPIALTSITVTLQQMNGSDGMATVPAEAFDASSYDNCTPNEYLKFSLSQSVFTCDDFGTNEVAFIVEDKAGNTDTAFVFVIVETSDFECPGGSISGRVVSSFDETIEGVHVRVSEEMEGLTTNGGEYMFPMIPKGRTLDIHPTKNDKVNYQVNMMDYMMLQLHVDGVKQLKDPHQLIAADIDNNGTVDYDDLFELHAIVTGAKDQLTNNSSWKFYMNEFTFAEEMNPLQVLLPDHYLIEKYYGEDMQIDFTGIKIGDITNIGNVQQDGDQKASVRSSNAFLKAGETHTIRMNAEELMSVSTMQLKLGVDHTKIQIKDIHAPILQTKGNWTWNLTKEDEVSIQWYRFSDEEILNGDALIEVEVVALADSKISDVLLLNTDIHESNMISQINGTYQLNLNFDQVQTEDLRLLDPAPNPLVQTSAIMFSVPKGKAQFSVIDVHGKVVFQRTSIVPGLHQIDISRADLPNAGVYSVVLENEEQITVKKLMVLGH